MWMCPPCHQLTPRTSSASAEWTTSCSGLQGRGRGRAGLSSFPSSGSDGAGAGGRLFSAPQDRGAIQLQHHGSAAPGKASLSTASQGKKWGGLNLGVRAASSLCQEFQVGCTLHGEFYRDGSPGSKVVGNRRPGKCRDMGLDGHLFYLPLGRGPACPAEVEGSSVWEMGLLLVVRASLCRESPLPDPGRIHTLPFRGAEKASSWDGALPPSLCPQYFKYEFPEGVDSVIVKVASNTAFPCSVISIQDVLVSQRPASGGPGCWREGTGPRTLSICLCPPLPAVSCV